MGCGASTQAVGPGRKKGDEWGLGVGVLPWTQFINEKCPMVRLDTSKGTKDILNMVGSDFEVDIKYCYVSQRGYYPNALNKANQDSYLVMENVLGNNSTHIFGIFDGHGETGDYCSHFAAENFASCLAREIRDTGGLDVLRTPKLNALYTAAFVKTNKLLKKSAIDDSLSGTTGITILLHGDTLYVGNVGDSRAIIATEGVNEKLFYSPLSSDQTPFRKDERERLKKRGAVIMTIEQIEGNEELHENWGAETGENIDESGDPPRVWDNSLEKPGCAFTRSIGDSVAEKIGVYAEPELLTWKLQPNDRFAIVASDGVFEFLSSQAVVDMVSKFSDPLEACKHVVAEAYRLWLQFDERTDDITMILINFEDIRQRSDVAEVALAERSMINDAETARPVRRVMSKTKRKEISENFENTDENAAEFNIDAVATAKTDEELKRIGQMLKANFMFQHLDPQQREQIFKVMQLRSVKAGTLIIQEGAAGEEMYIIDSGEFTVLKKDETGTDNLVFTYTNIGASFGELSLMYGKPRAASVRAKSDGMLWVIGRQAFRAVLMKKKQEGIIKLFKSVPLFKELSLPIVQRLCSTTITLSFNDGDVILSSEQTKSSDSHPWCLAMILSGSIKLNSIEGEASNGSKSPRKQTRTEGMFIAECEIGGSFSSAIAEGRTKLSCVPEDAFLSLLGNNALIELKRLVREKNKGKTGKRKPSIFSTPELTAIAQLTDTRDLTLEGNVVLLGNFATVGTYKRSGGVTSSCKFIGKANAVSSKVDGRLLLERQILAALGGNFACIPRVVSSFMDKKCIYLVYEDTFMCDLSIAMANSAIDDDAKLYYTACLFSAVSAFHESGVYLRYVNPASIYITNKGIPKIVDLRYAKKMDGQKAFTICGDPLYFAPEIVTQRGYDHGADLWALGILYFELFEGVNPIGSHDTDETAIFKKLAAFNSDTVEFTKKTPKKAKSLMSALLEPDVNKRLGYNGYEEVKAKKIFNDIDWKSIGKDRKIKFEVMGHVDAIDEAEIVPVEKASAFDLWN